MFILKDEAISLIYSHIFPSQLNQILLTANLNNGLPNIHDKSAIQQEESVETLKNTKHIS